MKQNLQHRTRLFLEQAQAIYPEYDYSRVVFANQQTKVEIGCPKHGYFAAKPNSLLMNRTGCPQCRGPYMSRANRWDGMLTKFGAKFGNRYDYSAVCYIGSGTVIKIICREHGEFWQLPAKHAAGQGCPQCAKRSFGAYQQYGQDGFEQRAKAKHGDKYQYGKFTACASLISITCSRHGVFQQTAGSHLQGHGCPECQKMDQQEFEQRARARHGNRYRYGRYCGCLDKIDITCPEHGMFQQTANVHLRGHGCSRCSKSLRYSASLFKQWPDIAAQPSLFYCVQFKRNAFLCYKVGITKLSYSKARINQHISDPNYTATVVKTIPMCLGEAWQKEQAFLKYARANGLSAHLPIPLRRGGDTECFLPTIVRLR